jgi:hypothetical protein
VSYWFSKTLLFQTGPRVLCRYSAGGKLVGLVTSRDSELVSNRAATLKSVMTPVKDLLTVGALYEW